MQVVGVVPGVRRDLFDAAPTPHLYAPFGREFRQCVRARADVAALGRGRIGVPSQPAETVRGVDPVSPILSLETRPMFRERNLMLAIVRVGEHLRRVRSGRAVPRGRGRLRRQGVRRLAPDSRDRHPGRLGATPGAVVRMIVREGALLASIGLVAGGLLAVATGTALRGMLYEGRGVDLTVLAAAFGVLLGAAFLAAWLPARRATRVRRRRPAR